MPDLLAIFDVDGTLIDSQAVIVTAMTRAFESVDLEPPSSKQVLSLVGLSLPRMIGALSSDLDPRVQSQLVASYRFRFGEVVGEGAPPPAYAGVPEGLARLKAAGVTLGIATGKSQRGINHLLESEGWQGLFATCQCADFHPSKPHPSMIRRALLETATEPEQAVMIGDTTYDMEMGQAAEVATFAVGWGYHDRDRLEGSGPDGYFTDVPGLVDHLLDRAR